MQSVGKWSARWVMVTILVYVFDYFFGYYDLPYMAISLFLLYGLFSGILVSKLFNLKQR
jgi:hypothetical protein